MMLTAEILREELQREPDERKHNIIFIGMSGAGKSYWTRILSNEYKYKLIDFDDIIGRSPELYNLIASYDGHDTVTKVGNFLGKPWEPEFAVKEKKYLEIEKRAMAKSNVSGCILDLSGSAIYHPQELAKIKKTGLTIYLQSSESDKRAMFNNYINNPKPVCWGGLFNKETFESNEIALEKCYQILLDDRAKKYEEFSDITLARQEYWGLDVNGFINLIFARLSEKAAQPFCDPVHANTR